jgi:hypothetical protein
MSCENCKKTDAPTNDVLGVNDPVDHPAHYNAGGIECIEAIQASMTPEGFFGYCKGNVMKYLWRAGQKGPAKQDLEKAEWYLNRMVNELEESE